MSSGDNVSVSGESDTTEQVPTDVRGGGGGGKREKEATHTGSQKHKVNVIVNAFYTSFELHVSSNTTGRELFDQVANLLNLQEVWFFGLNYKDPKGLETWLKLKKKIFVQDVGKKRPVLFNFRAKFYPEEVDKELTQQTALRLFYEQVKEEVVSGELYCPIDSAILLASYMVQETYGNYNTVLQPQGFLAQQHILPKKLVSGFELSPQQWEDRIVNFYKDHREMNKEQVMMEYLKLTQDLEMFGIAYFAIKNKKGTELWLGVDALGLNVYEKENKLKPKLGFPWDEIRSISFKDKRFTINPVDDKSPNFIFFVTKSRINKKILALCMGNHELFIRRRKVSPSQRSSTVSNRTSELEKRASKMSKVTEDIREDVSANSSTVNEPVMNGAAEYEGGGYEKPHSYSTGTQEEEYNEDTNEHLTTDTYHESAIVHHQDTSVQLPSASTTIAEYNNMAVRSKTPSPEVVTRFKNEDIPQNIVATRVQSFRRSAMTEDNTHLYNQTTDLVEMYGYEELPERPVSPGARSLSPGGESLSTGMGRGSPVRSLSPKSPKQKRSPVQLRTHSPLSNVQSDSSSAPGSPVMVHDDTPVFDVNVDTSEDVVHYATVIPKHLKKIQKEDSIPERRRYLPRNKQTYEKLVELFEDLSSHHKGIDYQYYSELLELDAVNKYQTLKHIRSGYAKDRVALFEAM